MLRLGNLSLPLDYTEDGLTQLVLRRLKLPASRLVRLTLVKKSVDARDKADVHFVLTVDAEVRDEADVLRHLKRGVAERIVPRTAAPLPRPGFRRPPVVVGAGPAGLFAALTLAQAGACPILIERGKAVAQRAQDVDAMQSGGVLDPESNVQFGEGGAGTFSDGKLTTGIKSPLIRTVLETFVRHGAPEDILYSYKPHIGTDRLREVVAAIRREIIRLGGEVRFQTKLTGLILHGEHVEGVTAVHDVQSLELLTDTVLLAIGHSARDTMQALFRQGVTMAQKPFAMGVRTPDSRGAYTFCMCPGGEVIPAASQPGGLCVNGMSNRARDGLNANSALLVGVRPEDFGDDHPLAGLVWQRSVEQAAYRAGGGDFRAPVQRVEDFLQGRATTRLGDVRPTYRPGVTPADLRACLPNFIVEDMRLGIAQMERQLHGFAHPDAVLTGVETRSSSPVRLPRDKAMIADRLDGLFPVGEGAGYAGGIVSAAVDGIEAARAAVERSLA